MKIWLVRHGQTDLNKQQLMQGQIDIPLNETGIRQAEAMRRLIGDVRFDAVYTSPLSRAIKTGAIVGGIEESEVIIDPRLIEADFGPYERKPYSRLGLPMTLYWTIPELFPAPAGVETIFSMVSRTSSFLRELEQKHYQNVLIAAHGGILRAVNGYLQDRANGIAWRPKMNNCELRIYESVNGRHRFVAARRTDTAL